MRCLSGLAVLVACVHVIAQDALAQQIGGPVRKELVAVLELDAVGADKVQASALTDRLREGLFQTGRFILVDRSQMDAVLNEQAFQQTGCTSQECAVKVGQVLGVRKLVTGKVTKLNEKLWLLSGSLVDVETAATDRTASVQHSGDFATLLSDGAAQLAAKLAGLTVQAAGPQAAMVSPVQELLNKAKALRKANGWYDPPDDAADVFSQAIALDPNSAAAYDGRGIVYVSLKEYPRAAADLEKAVELEPGNKAFLVDRGNLFRWQQQDDRAILDYSAAIKADPLYSRAYAERGLSENGKGMKIEACQDWKRACDLKHQQACRWVRTQGC